MADNLIFPFNLASDRGLPSQSLPTLLVKLLTHRCTIACAVASHRQSLPLTACQIKDLSVPTFAKRISSQRRYLTVSWLQRIALLQHVSPHPHKVFISVALSTRSRAPEFLRRPVLRCPDFPHLKGAIIRLLQIRL